MSMTFETNAQTGLCLKRYKRFFADVEHKGQTITIHVPNTGSLKGVLQAPQKCLFTLNNDPKKKLAGTLQALEADGTWVGVNTQNPNRLLREAWDHRFFGHWQNFDRFESEVAISKETRLDGRLTDTKNNITRWVEVKNVTMSKDQVAMFPDSVTERGRKHLLEMTELIKNGDEAEMVYIVQRNDCVSFAPNKDLDPKYAEALKKAVDHGLLISIWSCEVNEEGVSLLENQLKPIF